MKQNMLIGILALLPCIAFSQGNSANAPGKQKGSGQSAKQFAPGQEKGSGQSAQPYAPGQQNKNQPIFKDTGMPAGKGSQGKNKK